MSYYVPDMNLEPPEDERKEVYYCTLCGEPVYEGDDYYDIPTLGVCCTECIDNSRKCDAECEGPDEDHEYDSAREEAMLDETF